MADLEVRPTKEFASKSRADLGDSEIGYQNTGLHEFMSHSDCDGEISPVMCLKIANELEQLLPALEKMGDGAGHIARAGGYGGATRKFIAGCRLAAENNEPLEFC